MYPAKFDYYRAVSLSDAFLLLKEHEGAKVLAGGHSLIPLLKLRLSEIPALIDIGRIDALKGISVQGDVVKIGALTTHRELEQSPLLPTLLPEAASLIGDPAIRNRGTIGGSIAHADPASDLPTVLLALDAVIHTESPDGKNQYRAKEFFVDMFETKLDELELITSIDLPITDAPTVLSSSAYEKLPNPASRYAMIAAAAVLQTKDDVCTSATITVGGLVAATCHCPSVEAALKGQTLSEDLIQEAAQLVLKDLDADEVMGDMHTSANYRYNVCPTIVKRALLKAFNRL